jgi:hypothetical protein
MKRRGAKIKGGTANEQPKKKQRSEGNINFVH